MTNPENPVVKVGDAKKPIPDGYGTLIKDGRQAYWIPEGTTDHYGVEPDQEGYYHPTSCVKCWFNTIDGKAEYKLLKQSSISGTTVRHDVTPGFNRMTHEDGSVTLAMDPGAWHEANTGGPGESRIELGAPAGYLAKERPDHPMDELLKETGNDSTEK